MLDAACSQNISFPSSVAPLPHAMQLLRTAFVLLWQEIPPPLLAELFTIVQFVSVGLAVEQQIPPA